MNNANLLKAFKSLAQETRLSILMYLVKKGKQGVAAGQIGEQFNLTGPTISFHLKILQEAGLIEHERDQQSILYRPNFAIIYDIAKYFVAHCCGNKFNIIGSGLSKKTKKKK